MHTPATTDTIVAVSTGWDAAPLGVVRLSGPDAHDLVKRLTPAAQDISSANTPSCADVQLQVRENLRLPATLFVFRSPRSFTGQDLVEIHTVGALPALREISNRLIEFGARRALPGEFTARAYMNGRLSVDQVHGVLQLISASDQSTARQAARLAGGSRDNDIAYLTERVIALLAAVEAGIDFVDEEDVTFITAEQLAESLSQLSEQLNQLLNSNARDWRRGKPHVALAGLPNAGKSTLFNALVGSDRAIVSPVLGTTRDVLSAEIDLAGVSIVLQDSAGLGDAVDELESAAHLAAELAAEQADIVLWIHDCATAWQSREDQVCQRFAHQRRVLILSKLDDSPSHSDPPSLPFAATLGVSAHTGAGIDNLANAISRLLSQLPSSAGLGLESAKLASAAESLRRTREAVGDPEIVALELRTCWESLANVSKTPLVEEVIGRIMEKFCIGK